MTFLDHLHESGKLTSTSLWKDLYSVISVDSSYSDMLGQPGETGYTCMHVVAFIRRQWWQKQFYTGQNNGAQSLLIIYEGCG